ncbi:MAG: DUF1841 family protein [Proteobacteria bacterium]|nr:DUF1841 family protein [Pseudomonadota bacterium]HQR03245.1 DUF1841 family protein [Rhodocyclaceae bacterium]
MFNPTRDQARQFLVDAWRKRQAKLPATPLEIMAADVVGLHPEYHALLLGDEDTLSRDWTPDQGETNPFLHVSLHLAIEEQLQIDQPAGIRAAFDALLHHTGDRHATLHVVLDCLAETLWRAQRDQQPLDGEAYLELLRREASR